MEEQKKFELPEIIILLMLAIANDVLSIFVDFVFLIPIIGQVIGISMEGVNVFIWAIILFLFIMKAGFRGGSSILQIAGGIAQFFGIPARTIVVAFGIYFVNHPKVAAVAELAAGKTEAFQKGSAEIGALNEAALQKMPESMNERVGAIKEQELGANKETERLAAEGAAGEIGGAYEYRAQPGLEETLEEGSEEKQKGGEVRGETGEGVAPPESFRGGEEKEEKNKKEQGIEEIEAERMGGAYAQTGEAQEKKMLEEAGLTKEAGAPEKKTPEVEAESNMVNLRGGGRQEDFKKAA
jgi:hypothetical protein